MNEKQLIESLAKGEEAAYRLVVDQYQEQVLNTCLGFVPNTQDAEDLTQEVFIEVFRSIKQFRRDSKLSTWLYRIAVSKSLEFIRYRKRKKRQAFFQSLIGLEDRQIQDTADWFNHPGVQLENKQRAEVLYQKIDQLPQNQRIAFTLSKLEQMSYKEIATIMDTSVSSVESLLFRAKKNLQKSLKVYYEKQII